MKGLLIVCSLAAVAFARPNGPTGSYIPADQGSFTSYNGNAGQGSIGFNQYASGSSGSNFGSGQFVGQSFGGNSGFVGGNGGYSSSSSSSVGSSGYHGGQGGGVHVTKNAYFFEGPDDEPAQQIRIHTQQGTSRLNHNLIFVKTPGYKAPIIPQINAQNLQNEEKTRVYVLVKKQDAVQDIVIPAAGAGSRATKPEVFYIKYKTQKEAEQQIRGIQQGGSAGINAQDVGSDGAFVSTITDTKENVGSSSFQSGSYNTGGGQGFTSGGTGFISGSSGDFGSFGGSQTVQTSHSGGSTNFGPAGVSGPY